MEIGSMITGSPLLHSSKDTLAVSTSAEARSNDHVQLSKDSLGRDQAQELVDGLNSFLEPTFTNIQYEYHEKLDDYYVQVINQETDEVIKEIPPKKLLDVYAAMAEMMGFIVDEKI
ncbi:flagellar protein FlaG [Gracilibacillus halophilus YIM-C55.5]|uniref:Flagellar protein FlaG n=1 Tax=Gracilibacillus halophilus YIM-C55.5 TaxID=1308866 RepID=N4WQL5_9BACI|nr:flagellar protein FlaG [Gracilibacillus halophilus]ENH98417.1 flagellar protein FlaG [Gracilibacillus halophilus YIM-C55.5]